MPADLPILICPNGTVMRQPSDAEAGVGLGIVPDITPGAVYDVSSLAPGPLVSRLQCMRHRRALTSWFSTAARLAAKPVHHRGSKTISDFPPGSPVRR